MYSTTDSTGTRNFLVHLIVALWDLGSATSCWALAAKCLLTSRTVVLVASNYQVDTTQVRST